MKSSPYKGSRSWRNNFQKLRKESRVKEMTNEMYGVFKRKKCFCLHEPFQSQQPMLGNQERSQAVT